MKAKNYAGVDLFRIPAALMVAAIHIAPFSTWNLSLIHISVKAQQAAFATGVPPDLYAFHRYTGNSACLYLTQDPQFQ